MIRKKSQLPRWYAKQAQHSEAQLWELPSRNGEQRVAPGPSDAEEDPRVNACSIIDTDFSFQFIQCVRLYSVCLVMEPKCISASRPVDVGIQSRLRCHVVSSCVVVLLFKLHQSDQFQFNQLFDAIKTNERSQIATFIAVIAGTARPWTLSTHGSFCGCLHGSACGALQQLRHGMLVRINSGSAFRCRVHRFSWFLKVVSKVGKADGILYWPIANGTVFYTQINVSFASFFHPSLQGALKALVVGNWKVEEPPKKGRQMWEKITGLRRIVGERVWS